MDNVQVAVYIEDKDYPVATMSAVVLPRAGDKFYLNSVFTDSKPGYYLVKEVIWKINGTNRPETAGGTLSWFAAEIVLRRFVDE